MKAQNFIKQFAPECSGNDLIPFSKVLALMESFAELESVAYGQRIHEMHLKTASAIESVIQPKPYPNEAVLLDAILDEDKMTIDLPNDANIIDDDLHFENHSI